MASPSRYKKLLEVSDQVDDTGQFRMMLVLAWHTGRRINAICHLRVSDVLLTRERVREALADAGQNEEKADHWPRAIRWRAEHDKGDYLTFSPIGETVQRS